MYSISSAEAVSSGLRERFILISHDIPFLNSVVNLIYHMENQKLDRYVGDYDRFMEVYEMKKSQLEAAYNRQQAEIAKLQDFVARNKARVATRNMAMSRQKKLDKMEVIELAKEKPKPEFHFLNARATGKLIFGDEGSCGRLCMNHFQNRLISSWSAVRRSRSSVRMVSVKLPF